MSMAVYIHIKSPSNLMAFLDVFRPCMLWSTSFGAMEYKFCCCGVQVGMLWSTSCLDIVFPCAPSEVDVRNYPELLDSVMDTLMCIYTSIHVVLLRRPYEQYRAN